MDCVLTRIPVTSVRVFVRPVVKRPRWSSGSISRIRARPVKAAIVPRRGVARSYTASSSYGKNHRTVDQSLVTTSGVNNPNFHMAEPAVFETVTLDGTLDFDDVAAPSLSLLWGSAFWRFWARDSSSSSGAWRLAGLAFLAAVSRDRVFEFDDVAPPTFSLLLGLAFRALQTCHSSPSSRQILVSLKF